VRWTRLGVVVGQARSSLVALNLGKEARGFDMHGLVTSFIPQSTARFYLPFQLPPLRLLLPYLHPPSAPLICFGGRAMEMVVAT